MSKRNLSEVLKQVLLLIPENSPDRFIKDDIERLIDDVAYCAPETEEYMWTFANRFVVALFDREIKRGNFQPWQKQVIKVWSGKDV